MIKSASIVIPVYNGLKMTIDCLQDVLRTHGFDNLEVIVVDDGSSERVTQTLTRIFPQITVLKNDFNMGFARTVNKGIEAATNDLVVLLNNDIRLPNSNWLRSMADKMDSDGLGMTAPAGGRMDSRWNYLPGEAKCSGDDFAYLVGWCLAVRRKVFDTIGLIPEDFGTGFFEDVLFGYRARQANVKMDITEGTGVQHKYHATFKREGYNITKEYNEKRKIFLDIIRKKNG